MYVYMYSCMYNFVFLIFIDGIRYVCKYVSLCLFLYVYTHSCILYVYWYRCMFVSFYTERYWELFVCNDGLTSVFI